ncbi:CDP-glycerol glycerophosphotransferase family protein [Alkalibaculum sp. M08DMB]|uniref:CDP-glycerol glycerophosphotransferase family protein n=1 Tax=Alkalibaculum sporogenes TaxID=2655001 RepID=A0A6A7K907_9FIRM|nr:CDP-glycerol glycerophosphotransferase family protein [Alkalibaculum sporogenes]
MVLKLVLSIINRCRRVVYLVLFRPLPIRSKTILFCSHLGKNYSCNPKAIYEELLKDQNYLEYSFVWAFKDVSSTSIDRGITVKYGSLKYLYYLSIAKYWIFNAKMPYCYPKKLGQIYLQTWHGTPLKRLAADIYVGEDAKFYRSEMSKNEMTQSYLKDSQRYDYMISANKFSSEAFKSAFKIEDKVIIETGYPRNDILTNSSEEHIFDLKEKYSIPKEKTIVLYAPTWRDNVYDTKGYIFELQVDFQQWYEVLGDDYVIIYKPHYLIYNTSNKKIKEGFVYDASQCEDINDLYLMSDILVTDYSSVFFDYGVLKRPVLFYMYDLETYRDNLRGFYLDIYTDLPGPILEDEQDVLQSILNIEEVTKEYRERMDNFYDEFCSMSDGNSSRKVIDIILK